MDPHVEDFVSEPTIEKLLKLKREHLISLMSHYDLVVDKSKRKAQIRDVLISHMVKNDILNDDALEYMSKEEKSDTLRIREMELEHEKEMRLRELEYEREKLEFEKEQERKRLEQEREKRECEKELKLKELEIMAAEKEKDRVMKLKLEKSKMEHFDASKYVKFVPPFIEKDVDKYFLLFEKVAKDLNWPLDKYTILLQSALKGKASETYTALSPEQTSDYQFVKESILKAYQLIPEAYRQKFRNYKKEGDKTHVEFCREKERLLDRWCDSEEIKNDYERLRLMFLLEEFKNCVHPAIKNYITEQKANTLSKAAEMADEYFLSHKHLLQKGSPQQTFQRTFHSNKNRFEGSSSSNKTTDLKPSDAKSTYQKSQWNSSQDHRPTCFYCRKKGHVISECITRQRDQKAKGKEAFPNALTTLKTEPKSFIPKSEVSKDKCKSDFIQEVYEPFLSEGTVSLLHDKSITKPIRILRDTGASQSLILAEAIPLSEKSHSGKSVLIQGEECGLVTVPLHQVSLKSDLVSGTVTVGARPSLPIEGVHLILGNDLAGDIVVVNPVMTEKPEVTTTIDPIEEEIPDLYPSCAVTRAMAQKANLENAQVEKTTYSDYMYDLNDTFLSSMYKGSDQQTSRVCLPEEQDIDQNTPLTQDKDLIEPNVYVSNKQDLSTKTLILEQQKDSTLSSLFQNMVSEDEIPSVPCCYYKKNGVLMRKWRPPDVPSDAEWAVKHQVVLPKSYRNGVLSMAHETPLACHLGVSKTYNKILNHFFWPLIKTYVSNFCRSCHTCQMVGKPNQKIPRAALHPIPAFEEPFSRVIIECVGPLPKTKSGNEFLLTIMCASTRFPEAIPLRNIKAKTIVRALIKFFTLVGLPKSIQSDQGSNFMSGLFQQVMSELNIQQYKSSAYHPESQGAFERFHQTLKNMIRTYCFQTEKHWDEGIHLLLFASRESVQESLGFSPFELVFGHSVRGPLKLMKEKLLSDEQVPTNLLRYVSDFKLKLSTACELAQKNLRSSQAKMKARYDNNTVDRNFKEGDQVLALLPIPDRPLQVRYFGPYTVTRKISDVNYIVHTPERRKSKQLCHINMLKKYVNRDSSFECSVGLVTPVSFPDAENEQLISEDSIENLNDPDIQINSKMLSSPRLNNSDILNNLDSKLGHLNPEEPDQLAQLIVDYKHLFPDVPSKTDKIFHDVDIGDSMPIKQHPYRMSPVKKECLKEEIQYLLENDFIEPSNSEWSSPCILVPKPDGTYRLCTDYRKVNGVTKTDSFPIPRIDDCIDKIGKAKYVTKFDLLKGFWQIPLTDNAKEASAFVTPDGLFRYKVMPFGMKNSPATFQRLINSLIAGMDGIRLT